MQDDMLSGNPITIGETAYDLDAFSGMIDNATKTEIVKEANRIYINSVIEYMAKTNKQAQEIIIKNELTDDYINYLKAMPSDYYADLMFSYGININPNLFTDITTADGAQRLSIQRITDMYTQILSKTDYADLSYLIPMLAPSIKQAPSNTDYLLSQYELIGENSKVATGVNEIMLVVDGDDELSDLLLARYGYYSQDEFLKIIDKATADEEAPAPEGYRDSFSYEELIGKTFTYYPTNSIYEKIDTSGMSPMELMISEKMYPSGYQYLSDASDISAEGIELKVVGILSPKDGLQFGAISSGIYYTEALTDYVLEKNADKSNGFMSFLADDANVDKLAISYNEQSVYGTIYSFTFTYDHDNNPETTNNHTGMSVVTYSSDMSSMVSSMIGGGESVTFSDQRDMLMRTFGGNDHTNNITIFPKSFDEMYLVSDYLERWNEKGTISFTLDGKEYSIADTERNEIEFTNTLELVIGLVNTMIDIVSYALIAFTSVSLIVSTVMIGIITYVSVVERIKEIGVIRSLGGRKKDVSHLFNAETFIIGSISGLMGITATYLISLVVNLILRPLINYPNIAALPIGNAIFLVALSIGLTLISGLIPASSAAKKDPVVALRTE